MTRAQRKPEYRWQVFHSYYNESGDEMQSGYPILYGTEAEAIVVKANLENGSDVTWFDPSDDASGLLFVDRIALIEAEG